MTTLSIQDPDFLRQRFYWFCLWPAFLVLILVTLAPTVYLFIISFTPLDLTRPETNWNFSNPVGQYKIIMEEEILRILFEKLIIVEEISLEISKIV